MSGYENAIRAVIRVGDGRGFVVRGKLDRLVITAAHCLPWFPPCASFSRLEERTYRELLGPLGGESEVCAECLFVDPIGDIAVLGSPDGQELFDEADAYRTLTESRTPLSITDAPAQGRGWLLSLGNTWFQCVVRQNGGPLWIVDAAEGIVGGISGSPIVNDSGAAIGVMCAS